MKKFLYILLFAFTSSMAITACTEENVTPETQPNNGGTGPSDGHL
jgi:hypothetical protein